MFAVIKTGGKQYSVESGKTLKIEKIDGKKGDTFLFDKVLVVADKLKQTLGTPLIEGAKVEATIIEQIRDKKIIVFKKRRRKNSRKTKGHRQYLTILKINKILSSSAKSNIKSKEPDKKKKLTKQEKKVSKVKNKKSVVKKKNTSKKVTKGKKK